MSWYDDEWDDEDEDEGSECMWCGERGCPGYECNEDEYNLPGRFESDL